jgi:hypothetical protein
MFYQPSNTGRSLQLTKLFTVQWRSHVFRRQGPVIKMAALNRNHELKEKSQIFIQYPYIRLGNLKFF